jgi:hypothetical protein
MALDFEELRGAASVASTPLPSPLSNYLLYISGWIVEDKEQRSFFQKKREEDPQIWKLVSVVTTYMSFI